MRKQPKERPAPEELMVSNIFLVTWEFSNYIFMLNILIKGPQRNLKHPQALERHQYYLIWEGVFEAHILK